MIINDGQGNGPSAGVDTSHRLKTNASTRKNYAEISRLSGDAFLFAIGSFQLLATAGVESALLYVKNTSEVDFHIENIRSCNSLPSRWMLYKNANEGTIITDAVEGLSSSLNLKSNKSANAVVYSGGDGKTHNSTEPVDHWINGIGHSLEEFDGSLVLGNGDSVIITAIPFENSTTACCRMIGYFE